MKRDERSDADNSGDDLLDRLLHEASWPEPEPDRVERLWRRWLLLPRVHTRRIGLGVGLAAAAALLIAVIGGSLLGWYRKQTQVSQVPLEPIEDVARHELRVDNLADSRTPTSYEKIVIVAASQRRRVVEESHNPPTEQSPIQLAIEQLIADPEAEPREVIDSILRATDLNRTQLESELGQIVRSLSGTQQQAAVRLLASVATRRSLPLLQHLSLRPQTHSAAMAGLARLVDPVALAKLAASELDPTLKSQLLAELLRRDGRAAVTLFLNFVLDRASFEVAIKAVDSVAQPPVETLFQMLDGSNYPLRIAAARVLGQIDGPVISQRLADMVMRDMNRREALIALLSCPGEDAASFLAAAERNTGLASTIRAARFQLHALQ